MNVPDVSRSRAGRRRFTIPLLFIGMLVVFAVVAATVVAINRTGEVAYAQSSAPAAPTGLNARSVAHDSVALGWDDPGDGTIEGYQILRRSRDGSEYEDGLGALEFVVVVDDTGSSAATYTDTSVTARTRYVYRVKARNANGLSDASGDTNAETPDAPPNVVIILADDLGWGDVRSNNPDSAMTTPRIDGIATSGAKFTDAHSPSSVCSPTRYGLLTGRYAWRTWLSKRVLSGYDRPLIGPDRPTLGTLLQGHGYRTAAIGKWHLGMDFARLSNVDEVNSINRGIDFDAEIVDGPVDHGFDEFFGTSVNLKRPPSVFIRNNRFTQLAGEGHEPVSSLVESYEVLDLLTEEAVAFIERAAVDDAPFFLYLPLHVPHTPLAPNADFAGRTGLGPYADYIAQMDWTVGQVLEALEEVGARDNTLVIFTSDNGSLMEDIPIPNHVDAEHHANGNWRGIKGAIYEGGHRVPLLMQWPREIEAGSAIDATVSLTDVYATLADIVEEAPEPSVAPDSVSLLPLLLGETVTRAEPVVHHSRYGIFAIRDGRWKLVFHEPRELYDLEQEPGERNNLAAAHPEVVVRLEAALAGIRAAEDGTLSDDATLRSMSLIGIDIGPFVPDVRTYTATLSRGIGTVEVRAIPTETDALVMITDADGQSARGWRQVRLDEGTTAITVTVTSPDGNATATYTVTVTVTRVVPRITGTVAVGEALTVGTSSIADVDWLDNPGYSYQWIRNDGSTDSDIVGATSTTYILAAEDEGTTIKVRVSFTDDAGNAETRTSAPTATVGAFVLQGELTAGQEADIFPVNSGYSTFGSVGGTLTPDSFVIEGTTYKVRFLTHSSESLWLGMDRELPTDFTLRVGDATYPGSGSKVPASAIGAGGYWWPSASPGWLGGEPVQVELIIHSGTALGDRQKAPVTGYFRNIPSEHDGTEDFSFLVYFSEGVATTAEALRDHVLSVTGGVVSSVEAVGGEGRIWSVSVTPDSRGTTVTVEIEADLDCELPEAICTTDGRRLFNRMELIVEAREYHPPTGAPNISGTAEVGDTLTVDTSGISDADGLTGATFSHQWVSYDGKAYTDIAGATDASYTLVSADEGRAIRVRVSFTDDAGYEESLTSNLARSERPYGLRAVASDGAVVVTWKLPVGWPYQSYYRILRNRPELGEAEPLVYVRYTEPGVTSYTDTGVEPGVLYVYRVKGVNFLGFTREASEPVEIRTAEPTPVENSPATGAPTISGTAEAGETLTADTSGIADEDGLENAAFAYQWITSDGGTDTDIAGATGSTYTLTDSEAGKDVKVRVSFTDDDGNSETLTSAAVYVSPPLTAEFLGVPASHDGETAVTFELRFSVEPSLGFEEVRDDVLTVMEGEVTAVRRTDPESDTPNSRWEITVEPEDDDEVRVVLPPTTDCAVDSAVCTAGGTMLSNRSAITVPGPTPTNTAATGQPTITGSTTVGSTLTAGTSGIGDANGMENATFAYQWLRSDAVISGATGATYTLVEADEGETMKVRVSFTDDDGFSESLTSADLSIPVAPLEGFFDASTVPASHSGANSTFTFQLYFSVEPSLEFEKVRDDVLTLTNVEVTAVRRTDPESANRNSRWEITVQPSGDNAVTIALSPTTDCAVDSAVCTSYGKRLSNSASITVDGP